MSKIDLNKVEFETMVIHAGQGADPAYGALAHLRLRRTDRDAWTLVQMLPQMYRPQDKAGAEQLEREGLLSERQDFGYLRRERVLSLDGAALVADALAHSTLCHVHYTSF